MYGNPDWPNTRADSDITYQRILIIEHSHISVTGRLHGNQVMTDSSCVMSSLINVGMWGGGQSNECVVVVARGAGHLTAPPPAAPPVLHQLLPRRCRSRSPS